MSQAIQLQVTQVGLEQSIAAAMKRVGSSSQINLGTNSRQINALSQPLGRITGQADEFSKSMEAANARVLAFGASAGIIAGVSKAMAGLVSSTIKVEKSLVEIGSVLNKTGADLDKFGQDIFNVAKNTGQSFDEVAKGALELSRQGLNAEDTLARLNDALILSRLSGLDATQSVEGLTAAFNSFQKSGITTAEILNKVVAVSQKYAVSERDIIEGLKRSAAVADLAGVSFEELAALITAVQQKTARGGAVIGNAFKTIFSRLQDKAVLSDLQDMGIAVTDLQGNVLPALKILEGLAGQMDKISQIEQADIAKKLGGVYQLDKLLAALKDLSSETSVTKGALDAMGKAGDSAYKKNAVLNETLSALINKVAISAEQLGAKLGEIGVTDSLKNILGFFNNLLEGIQNILGEESGLGNLVRGLVKGLGSFLAGPGLALFGGIILKLSKDLVQFGFASLKAFFGIGKAVKDVQNVEGAISQILAKNVGLQQQLFALEGNRAAQLRLITGALVEQEALLRRSASISSGLAAPLYNVGARATSSGLRVGNSAGGYMPTVAKESKAIKQGVGGARSGDKPVVMPNFNFGGGKKGTMVAHTGEYVVPNFNGSGGSAVFNRRMVQSMGLPSGAKKIGAAGGFVPNFAEESPSGFGPKTFLDQFDLDGSENPQQVVDKINNSGRGYFAEVNKAAIQVYQNKSNKLKVAGLPNGINIKSDLNTKLLAATNSYNANARPNSAVMLIPQNQAFDAAGANTDFKKDNQTRYGYQGFRGGVAGVDKNISNIDKRNLSEISNIDNLIGGALSVAAISVLEKIQPGLKVDDVSSFSVENIKKTLEAGGAGAFGSIKGALFESIIGKVAKAKGRKFEGQGSLDIDFDAGGKDSRKTLETIFGLTANQFDFADFKNSIGQKDSYINQVISYLPKNKDLSKQANAAGGYIPNFSKYIYDSDRLNPDKGATLAAVLSSKAKKNLLIGPAGSGKSTFAGKSGQFLSGIDDVPKATEIDILSGAARAKGGLSKSLESIIAAVNSSGGKVSYLYTKNLEILSRRRSRTSPSEGDLRSIKQLKGTRYAPLNQFDFLSNVKSKSKNFNLIQGAAGGYVPNFVGKSREVGRGVQGAFYKLGNQKDGTQVGVKKFFKDGPSRAVEFEWLVAEYLSKHTKIPAVFGPKNLSTLQDSVRKQSIRKELVSDPLAKNALGSQVSEMFGRGVLFNALQAQGLSIGDLHGSNYTVNANAENAINELGNFPQNATGAFSTLRDMASKGSRIGILDTGAAKVSEPARTAIGNILKMASQSKTSAAGGFIPNFAGETPNRGIKFTAIQIAKGLGKMAIKTLIDQYLGEGVLDSVEASGLSGMKASDAKVFMGELSKLTKGKHRRAFERALLKDSEMQKAHPDYYRRLLQQGGNSAGGFMPNFANPLQAAVGREMAAGVPASQIYIDKSPSLKNAANPMGLMVANRRDEPSGGFQGISRARREGANPMMYGAAGGFVPNYAAAGGASTGPDLAPFAGKTVPEAAKKIQEDLTTALSNITKEYQAQLADVKENAKQIEDKIKIEKRILDTEKKILQEKIKLLRQAKNNSQGSPQDLAAISSLTDDVRNRSSSINQRKTDINKITPVDINQERKKLRESALTQRKEERNNAATLTTAVSANAKRGLMNPTTPRVVDPKVTPSGNRDMLGAIFAVQGAMSALTGATEGATSKVGLFSNALASSLGSITTASFAFQGLKNLAPEGSKTAAALGKIGGAAIAAYAGFEVMKLLYKSIKIFNGDVERGSIAMAKFNDQIENFSIQKLRAPQTETEKTSQKQSVQRIIKEGEDAAIQQALGIGNKGVGAKTFSTLAAGLDRVSGDRLNTNEDIIRQATALQDTGFYGDSELSNIIASAKQASGNNVEIVKQILQRLLDRDIEGSNGMTSIIQRYLAEGQDPYISPEESDKKFIESNFKRTFTDKSGFEIIDPKSQEEMRSAQFTLNTFRKAQDFKDQQEKKAQEASSVESEKSYRLNLGKIQAEIALENKLASFKEGATNIEIAKLQEISDIQNNNLLTEDQRAKAIAQANYGYDQGIQALQTIEQKTKNIGQALIESVKGGIGIIPGEIQATVDKIQKGLSEAKLPELNTDNLKYYADAVAVILKESGVATGNQKAIIEALMEAERVNKSLTAEQEAQLKKAAEQLGIDLETLGITRKIAIEEAKINSMMDSAKAVASFNLEKRSLGIASDMLAINQQIEKIKRETSLNELEKAQQIFKLEEQRVGLEEGKIQVDFDKSANDAARTFQDKILAIASGEFGIKSSMISGSLSGGPESVVAAARNKIPESLRQSFGELIAEQRKQYTRDLELATKQKDLDKSGIAPVIPDTVIDKVNRGFSGGMGDGVAGLQNQINTFAFDLGEKIPQMFSDNMSSAINKMIEGGESFGNILQGAAYEFVKGINQANIQNLSNKFSNFLFKSDGGAASGIGSMLGFASGGKVKGGSGSKDDVPAMLMGGEYVVNKKAVSKYGAQFMESINSGTLSGYAKGGKVQSGPQGNFYAPGTFGRGAIEGKRNLLDFATQSGTSGMFDQMTNSAGYQSISLEPESSRLSVSGMRNSPMFDATQSAKGQAFDLYLQQYNAEREAKKQAKEQKKALTKQLIMLVASTALGGIGKAAMTGGSNAVKALGENAKFLDKAGAFFGGMYKGGDIGDGNMGGGLKNLFSGNFGLAYQSEILKASPVSDIVNGYTGTSPVAQGSGVFRATSYGLASIDKTTAMDQQKADAGNPLYKGFSQTIGASGRKLRAGYSVASNFYPLGTILNIGGKEYQVDDTGGMSKNVIDFFAGGDKNLYKQFASLGNINPQVVSKKAIGGMISSTSGIDTVPAMLSGGEFVMNRSAVQGIGSQNLQSMNSGGTSITSEETSKELNEKLLAKLDELINSSGSAGNITINVAPSGQTTQDNSQDPSAGRQQLARQIKDAVLQIINDEKRIGGSLRR